MSESGAPLHLVENLKRRYALLGELGRGGMATVYLADDLTHGRKVAIKVLAAELSSEEATRRFLHEISVTANLQHPHILPLIDSGAATGSLYYVMPFVEGESLRERLDRERKIDLDSALEIVREVAGALGYAHEHGVLHRDVKPGNIMLTAGHAVLMDFGIARALQSAEGGELTRTGAVVGSPRYLSPEQIHSPASVDERSDQYALACVLYEMLVGAPPFSGDSLAALLAQHQAARPVPMLDSQAGVPTHIEHAVQCALRKAPEERFKNMAEFAAALAVQGARDPSARGVRTSRSARILGIASLGTAAALLLISLTRSARIVDDGQQDIGPRSPPELRQVSFSGDLREALVSPDGNFLVGLRLAATGTSLELYDLANGQSRILARGNDLCCAAWTPDGSEVSFGRFEGLDGQMRVVPRMGGPERDLPLSEPALEWSPDGTRLISWAENMPVVWATHATTGVRTVYLGRDPDFDWVESVAAGPNATFAVLTTIGDRDRRIELWGEDVEPLETRLADETFRVSRRTIVADTVQLAGLRWASDGASLFYLRARGRTFDLHRLRMSGGSAAAAEPELVRRGLEIVPGLRGYFNIGLSETGVVSIAEGSRYSNLWRIPLDVTEAPRRLTSGTLVMGRPTISPDGSRIAFQASSAGAPNIYVSDIGGTDPRQVTFTDSGAEAPAWSPSGDTIAFLSREGGTRTLWTTPLDAFEPTRRSDMVAGMDDDARPVEWAPGRVPMVQDPDWKFYRIADDGRAELLATDQYYSNWMLAAQYGPDGSSVALTWNKGGDIRVWIQQDDEDPKAVSSEPLFVLGWAPSGSRLYLKALSVPEILAFDLESRALIRVLELPFDVDPAHIDVLPDGTAFIAAVFESPADAFVFDLPHFD